MTKVIFYGRRHYDIRGMQKAESDKTAGKKTLVAESEQRTACAHCGDLCLEGQVLNSSGLSFCCQGCLAVHSILSQESCPVDASQAIRQAAQHFLAKKSSRFDYLEDPDIEDQLADFRSPELEIIRFHLPQVHCATCVGVLEKLQDYLEGVVSARLSFLEKILTVSFVPGKVTLRQVVELLTLLGYEPSIRLRDTQKAPSSNPLRTLYLRLGLAGFAFGNVMLLAFPSYLDGQSGLSWQFNAFFGWLSLVLSLPVLLVSCAEFYIPALHSLREKKVNLDIPVVIGLAALFARSAYDIIAGLGPGYLDSFNGLVLFLLVGRLVKIKTFDTLAFDRDFRSYLPLAARIVGAGGETTIAVSKLRAGDQILVRNRELVCADSVLESDGGFVDYSFVTGEATPVEVTRGQRVYAGGIVSGRSLQMSVTKAVSDSYISQLWNNEVFSKRKKDTLEELGDRFGYVFTLATIAIALLGFALHWTAPHTGIHAFISVLIIACPCALTLAAPFTLATAMKLCGKAGFFLRSTATILDLSKLNTIVFDKTGTLSNPLAPEIDFHGALLSESDIALISSVLDHSSHPLSRAVRTWLSTANRCEITHFDEAIGKGMYAETELHCLRIGSKAYVLHGSTPQPVAESDEGGAGVQAGSQVHVLIDGQYRGYFRVRNVMREGLSEIFPKLHDRYDLFLLSGDSATERDHYVPFFGKNENLAFSRSPEEKLHFVRSLKEQGKSVAMIGDGLNDAGALKASNVGIAISEATGVFTPSSDAILHADSLARLPQLLTLSRFSVSVIVWAFVISVFYNAIGLAIAVGGTLTPMIAAILMPVSSLSIIAFCVGAMHLKFLSLRFDRGNTVPARVL